MRYGAAVCILIHGMNICENAIVFVIGIASSSRSSYATSRGNGPNAGREELGAKSRRSVHRFKLNRTAGGRGWFTVRRQALASLRCGLALQNLVGAL